MDIECLNCPQYIVYSASWIQTTPSNPFSLRFTLISLPFRFPTKILYVILISLCVLHYLIILMIFVDENKVRSST